MLDPSLTLIDLISIPKFLRLFFPECEPEVPEYDASFSSFFERFILALLISVNGIAKDFLRWSWVSFGQWSRIRLMSSVTESMFNRRSLSDLRVAGKNNNY